MSVYVHNMLNLQLGVYEWTEQATSSTCSIPSGSFSHQSTRHLHLLVCIYMHIQYINVHITHVYAQPEQTI